MIKRILFCFLFLFMLLTLTSCGQSPKEKAELVAQLNITFLKNEKGEGYKAPLNIESILPTADGKKLALLLFPTKFNAKVMIMEGRKELGQIDINNHFVDIYSLPRIFNSFNAMASLLAWSIEGDKLLLSLNPLDEKGEIGLPRSYILNIQPSGIEIENPYNGFTSLGIFQNWSSKEGTILLKKVEKPSFYLFDISGKPLKKEDVKLGDEYKTGQVFLKKIELKENATPKTIPIKHFHLGMNDYVFLKGQEIFIVEQGLKGKIRIWKIDEKGEDILFKEIKLPQDYLYYALPSPSLRYLVIKGYNFEKLSEFIQIINLADGMVKREIESTKESPVSPLCWSPNEKYLALAREKYEGNGLSKNVKQSVLLLDMEGQKDIEIPVDKGSLVSLSFANETGEMFFLTRTPSLCYVYHYRLP